MSSQLNLQDVINLAKTVYFPDLWAEIENYFGEDSKSIDLTFDFDYLEIIQNGSKEECKIYYFINTIQQYIINAMFDME